MFEAAASSQELDQSTGSSATQSAPSAGASKYTSIGAPLPKPIPLSVGVSLAEDFAREHRVRAKAKLPVGNTRPSWRNTQRMVGDPLNLMLENYNKYGPVFSFRVLHEPVVMMIGAEANHQVLVTKADSFNWRLSRYRQLWPLLGDGMLNIDGEYHDQMRHLLLPVFHRQQVQASVSTMVSECEKASEELRDGETVDVYAWTRELALKIAVRAMLGIADAEGKEHEVAEAFESALAIYSHSPLLQIARGPGTPYAHAMKARKVLDGLIAEEIRRRRSANEFGAGALGMLLSATDAEGEPLKNDALRDQAMTLLFAGHDTTTATITFLFYELSRNQGAREAVESELDQVLAGRVPQPTELDGKTLPVLERTIQETLRRYPAAWIGPRRTSQEVEIAGVTIPAEVSSFYSSWATHHLPEYYPDPYRFDPDRFLPQQVADRPKGAYIPFGSGSRMCLGKRFGEYEIRALSAILLSRMRFAADPNQQLRISTTPTLGPRGGLKFKVTTRTHK